MRVFDFDNTIYDGESGADLFLYFLKKDTKGLIKYAPKFFEGFLKYKKAKITIDEMMNDYGFILKEYSQKIDDIYDDFEKFWDLNEHKVKDFYRNIQREDDVIVSACPVCLLKIICDRIGIKNYLGSDIDPLSGVMNNICYKDKKVDIYRASYGDTPIDEFFTDSISDKPMMDVANNVFWVDDNKITQIKKDGEYIVEIKFK